MLKLNAGLTLKERSPPLKLSGFKLIAFDMDSTLINIECIDEVASAMGVGEEVALITAKTMSGEIKDFKESFKQRLALLKGTPVEVLQSVFERKLSLNPGAQNLTVNCQSAGLKTLLVSGGFTYFAERVKDLLHLDFARANELEIANGRLTGGLVPQEWGTICDAEVKKILF
jgi:phosphoserine phosphatase